MSAALATSPLTVIGNIGGLNLVDIGRLLRWEIHAANWAPTRLQMHFDYVATQADASLQAESTIQIEFANHQTFNGHIIAAQWTQDASGRCQVTLTAIDNLRPLADAQKLRRFSELSTRAIITEICSGSGISCSGDAGPTWRDHYQIHQSDLDFIIELCQRSNLGFHLTNNELQLFPLDGRSGNKHRFNANTCQHLSLKQSSLGLPQQIQAQGWDFSEQQSRRGNNASTTVGIGQRNLAGLVADNDGQLDALAASISQQRHSQHAQIQFRTAGFPTIKIGDRFRVDALRGSHSDSFVCMSVQISNDAQLGLSHVISSEIPTIPRPQRDSILCCAQVTDVADPKKRGRIRVQFKAYNDLDSHWLPVVTPGAGPDRGLFILPDTGDYVAVLAANGYLSQAVVLGGLMGQAAFNNAGIVGSALKQYHIRAPGGHLISLDDSGSEILVQHAKGSALSMTNSKVDLTVNGNLNISAAGKSITFTANKIDFKRG